MLAMYALTRTPFGRMCNAVRENPERAQFVGYNPQMVRFIAFSLAGLLRRHRRRARGDQFRDGQFALWSAPSNPGVVLLAAYIGGALSPAMVKNQRLTRETLPISRK